MKVNLQIEGQRGLNWPRWQRLVPAVEELRKVIITDCKRQPCCRVQVDLVARRF